MPLAGYKYCPALDTFQLKAPLQHTGRNFRGRIVSEKEKTIIINKKRMKIPPPPLTIKDFNDGHNLSLHTLKEVYHNSRKTLRLMISRAAAVYDVAGIIAPLIGQLRDVVRCTTITFKII